ncbi:hypothetical protein MGMO_27c00110 [Methyloglobulus morosus KoM1]|uniref:Uncharacterized protein n=2 Tax=Methyloglobulus TaxID=1410680 RepID=V5C934_9GAMM|nr:hypothetical protein MGMO_27c00110 [Methyloglobulus morosus KoM1]
MRSSGQDSNTKVALVCHDKQKVEKAMVREKKAGNDLFEMGDNYVE